MLASPFGFYDVVTMKSGLIYNKGPDVWHSLPDISNIKITKVVLAERYRAKSRSKVIITPPKRYVCAISKKSPSSCLWVSKICPLQLKMQTDGWTKFEAMPKAALVISCVLCEQETFWKEKKGQMSRLVTVNLYKKFDVQISNAK